MNFNVTVVSGPNDIQFAFNEVRDSLAWALSRLGHKVSVTNDWFSESGEINIIFGAELIAHFQLVPGNSIIYNLEQPSHPRFAWIQEAAERIRVWDSCRQNCDLIPGAIHVPVGYTPNLTRIKLHCPPAYDAAFFGFMTPRRTQYMATLAGQGLKTFVAGTGCYGGVRDEILSRSAVALNIHHDGREQFEIVRCSYWMANRVPVMTEPSADMLDYENLSDGLMTMSLDLMRDQLLSVTRDQRVLQARGEAAFTAIQRRDYVRTVERALDGESLDPGSRRL